MKVKNSPNKDGDLHHSHNKKNTDGKSDNIVEDVGQSSKVDDNEGWGDELIKVI